MIKEIRLQDIDYKKFDAENKGKVLSYLRRKYSPMPDDDLLDIYQESLTALFSNIQEGKLKNLTSSLFTYFLRICINQTLKFLGKQQKVESLSDDSTLVNKDVFLDEKIDELFKLCMEEEETLSQSELIVRSILEIMPETCRNIFRGYYWDNLTTATIADMFGFANANSVKSQKYKCLQKFRNKYNELMNKNNG